jgi:hypothetical protein
MWHCNVKTVKPGIGARMAENACKRPRIAKELPRKPVRGVQTLYMTGRMRNKRNQVTAGGRAVPLRAAG